MLFTIAALSNLCYFANGCSTVEEDRPLSTERTLCAVLSSDWSHVRGCADIVLVWPSGVHVRSGMFTFIL